MAEAKTVSSFKDSRIRVVHKSFPGSADQTVLVWTASLEVWCGVEPAGLAKLAAGCFFAAGWFFVLVLLGAGPSMPTAALPTYGSLLAVKCGHVLEKRTVVTATQGKNTYFEKGYIQGFFSP